MKKIISILLSLTIIMAMTACGNNTDEAKNQDTQNQTQTEQTAEPEKEQADNKEESSELYADAISVTIELENGAVMKGELYPNLAPKTVENFVKLAKDNFYNGLIFHRVIEGFMIQGGGYDENGNHKDAKSITGEFTRNGFTNNLKHTRGVLSMARTSFPNSASSQFFIMHKDSPHLDGQYAAFGKITEGIEVVDKIAGVKTDYQDCPIEPQIIESIRLA